MKLRQLLSAAFLIASGFCGAAIAQTCINSPRPVTVNYPSGGSISISYQICYPSLTDYSSFYWYSTMSYNNVNFDGSFSVNGSVGMQLNWANDTIGSVVFSGGPLTFNIGGQPYTVSFSDLSLGSVNN